jgi:hypothetical protein
MKLYDIAIIATIGLLFHMGHHETKKAQASQVYVGHQAYTIEYYKGHEYLVHASGAICQLPDPPPKPTVIVNPEHPFIGRDQYGNARKLPND